jgi:tRNA/rRNA methyltransferase
MNDGIRKGPSDLSQGSVEALGRGRPRHPAAARDEVKAGKEHEEPARLEFSVILVQPKFQGNIGLIARLMKNFGVADLRLVDAPGLRSQAWKRAMHAQDILEAARSFKTLDEALEDVDYIVGTSGISSKHDKKHLRNFVRPPDFAKRIRKMAGRVGLLFGRENYGLSVEELTRCDLLVHIPTNPEYPILNISHAVAIVLYELFQPQARVHVPKKASGFEKEVVNRKFSELLELIEYPAHKRANTQIMFRRILGRAVLSEWEFFTLMGVISKAINKAERGK